MSISYTYSTSVTFSHTHAVHLAAKVATDLKRIQRFYGSPGDDSIRAYEEEAMELLKAGYLEEVTYGFKRNGQWIEPTLRYTARDLLGTSTSDDPGGIRPSADVVGASFTSFLTYSRSWGALGSDEKEAFEKRLPFRRTGAPEPSIDGYLQSDRTYSAGGRALDRVSVRSLK